MRAGENFDRPAKQAHRFVPVGGRLRKTLPLGAAAQPMAEQFVLRYRGSGFSGDRHQSSQFQERRAACTADFERPLFSARRRKLIGARRCSER